MLDFPHREVHYSVSPTVQQADQGYPRMEKPLFRPSLSTKFRVRFGWLIQIWVNLCHNWPCAALGVFMICLGLDMRFLLNPRHNVSSLFLRESLYSLNFHAWGVSIAVLGLLLFLGATRSKSVKLRFGIAVVSLIPLSTLAGEYLNGCRLYPHLWHSMELIPLVWSVLIVPLALTLKLGIDVVKSKGNGHAQ
jgi:hypothetical protein